MKLKKHYDVIIIGGGIGGLASAAHLSIQGKKVLLVEKNRAPGGCCTSFRRGEFIFDAGAHLIGSCGRHGYLGNLFLRLGMNLHFHKVNPVDRYFFKDDIVVVPDEFSEYAVMLSKYGSDEKTIQDFFTEVNLINKKSRLDNILDSYRGTVYQEILDKYFHNNKKIQAILSAQYGFVGERPNNASVYSFVTTLFSYIKGGAYYPYGGSQRIPDEFVKTIKKHNGEMVFGSKPRQILTTDDVITGIVTDDGDVIECDYLISNISSHELYTNLLKFNITENEKLVNRLKVSNSVFSLYVGCTVKDSVLAEKIGWHYSSYDMNRSNFLYIFSSSIIDKSLAPKGCNIMQVYTESDYDKYADDNSYCKIIEEELLAELTGIIPGLKHSIVCMESATPKTIEKYTGNPRGAIYGWAQTPDQISCDERFKKPKNLFQCGHWTYPGGGIMAVAISGITAAQTILNMELKTSIKRNG